MASKTKWKKTFNPRRPTTPVSNPTLDVSSRSDIRPALAGMDKPSQLDPAQFALPMTPPKRQRLPKDLPKTKVHRATYEESTEHDPVAVESPKGVLRCRGTG